MEQISTRLRERGYIPRSFSFHVDNIEYTLEGDASGIYEQPLPPSAAVEGVVGHCALILFSFTNFAAKHFPIIPLHYQYNP